MSTWLPSICPSTTPLCILPSGNSDDSISPDLIHTLETALDRRRKQIKETAAPPPLGVQKTRTTSTRAHDESRQSRQLPAEEPLAFLTPPTMRGNTFIHAEEIQDDQVDEHMHSAQEDDDEDDEDDAVESDSIDEEDDQDDDEEDEDDLNAFL